MNVGFEFRNRDFANPAEFILDIAADRGNVSRAPKNSYKKAMGGTPALSVLDLADVCRSMSHATASSIAASSSDTGVLERDSISGKISKTREKNSSINGNSIELSTGLKSAATQSPTAFPRDLTYHTSLPNSSNSSNSSILPVGERAKVTNPAPGAMILARRALTDLKNDVSTGVIQLKPCTYLVRLLCDFIYTAILYTIIACLFVKLFRDNVYGRVCFGSCVLEPKRWRIYGTNVAVCHSFCLYKCPIC